MLNLNHRRTLTKLGLCFSMLLINHNAGAIKKEKKKEVAVVPPTPRKESAATDDSNSLNKTKLQSELEIENALIRARLEKELSAIMAQIERLRLERERLRLNKEIGDESTRRDHDRAMLLLNMEKEKLTMELDLAQARFMKQMEQYNIQVGKLDKEIQLEKGKTQLLQETQHRLQAEMEVLRAKETRDKCIEKKPIYLKDPLIKQSNKLVISDRSIELNGRITPWKADYIVDQIDYFNNKHSQHPIFLIIGNSPGGSVHAGWNILQAIEHSKAPVYVVVKTFAASMAALITTLATKSYAYPNAVILHHQPSSWVWGNLRETREHYAQLNEVWQRLSSRVAKKMGISLKAFEKKLYEKSMRGDWEEYGNQAKKLKWVDYVISGIQDSAVSKLPDATDYSWEQFIKKYYSGADSTKATELSEQEILYYALTPHDFDYSYHPNKQVQMLAKEPADK